MLSPALNANATIAIEDCEYLASGTIKLVYRHPNWDNAVLKIMRPELVDSEGQFAGQRGLKRRRTIGIYREFAREISQYLSLCRRNYDAGNFSFPVATPLGFVPTDRGLGLLSERISGSDSSLAPSLRSLVQKGEFSDVHAEALKRFFDDCSRLHIVFGEVNWAGIVFTTSRSGRPEFVLVDGSGEKNFLPLKSLFWHVNDRRVREIQRRIGERIDKAGRSLAARGKEA